MQGQNCRKAVTQSHGPTEPPGFTVAGLPFVRVLPHAQAPGLGLFLSVGMCRKKEGVAVAGDWQVTQRLLRAGMDTMLLKQRVVAENIANVNTPGYKRRDVTFPAILRQAERRLRLRTTHPGAPARPTAPGSPHAAVATATARSK